MNSFGFRASGAIGINSKKKNTRGDIIARLIDLSYNNKLCAERVSPLHHKIVVLFSKRFSFQNNTTGNKKFS